ncbi:MAG: hypothetical protein ACFFBI_01850 [Promethearchaeota archaeon]
MRNINKKNIKHLILLFALVSVFMGSLIGNNQIGRFNTYFHPKIAQTEIDIVTPENKTYTKPMNGYYPASFGFEDTNNGDLPITNTLANWSDYSPYSDCSAEVVSEYLGHKKVLHIDDDNNAGKTYVRINTTNDITCGTIEYWVLYESAVAAFVLRTYDYDLSEFRFNFGIYSGKWIYYFGGGWNSIPAYDGTYDPVSDTWYHISLNFRCEGAPAYKGLEENTFDVEINSIPSGGLKFRTNGTDMEYIYFESQSAATTDNWVDAFSLSWDPNYNIGDNLNEGLLLSFDTNFSPDWQGYSLDGAVNKKILGNTTIPFPSDGIHNIQVYGNDTMGTIYESNLMYFTIDTISTSTPPNIPGYNLLIIMGIASLIGIMLIKKNFKK